MLNCCCYEWKHEHKPRQRNPAKGFIINSWHDLSGEKSFLNMPLYKTQQTLKCTPTHKRLSDLAEVTCINEGWSQQIQVFKPLEWVSKCMRAVHLKVLTKWDAILFSAPRHIIVFFFSHDITKGSLWTQSNHSALFMGSLHNKDEVIQWA